MATSLGIALALVVPLFAQERTPHLPAYTARTQPWPGAHKAPAPPPPRQPEPPRTMFFKKEPGPPVFERAAGLLMPVGADEQLPKPAADKGSDSAGFRMEEVFRLESENQMRSRVNQERVEVNKKVPEDRRLPVLEFAPQPEVSKLGYTERRFALNEVFLEPNYVCYNRLLFEDKNTERYGWTMGPLQPLASASQFFSQVQWLPYKLFSFPRHRYDCSAGHCLPGDPVPYLMYPPGLSLTGAAAEAGVIIALSYIFP